MFHESFKEDGCLEGGLRVFQGSFKGVSRMFYVLFKEVSSVFQGCFEDIFRMFYGSFQCVLRKFQGRFREVSLMFYESLK